MPSPYKIAIVGSGPVGALLGRLLLKDGKADREVTLFEADASPDARTQGGSLDLGYETGLHALKKAGLWEEFLKYGRYEADSGLMTDMRLNIYMHRGGEEADEKERRPEIDRVKLRGITLASLPEGSVKYGKKLERLSTGDNVLHFQDGTQAGPFDFVVGADGAWSRVRKSLDPSGGDPVYTGWKGGVYHIANPKKVIPELEKYVNRGGVYVMDYHTSIVAHQLGDGDICMLILLYNQPDPAAGRQSSDPRELKQHLLSRKKEFAPALVQAFEAMPDDPQQVYPTAIHALPRKYTWPSNPRATLIGDSAHVMGPFAGEGVNLGMMDAVELADVLEKVIELRSSAGGAASQTVTGQAALIAAYEDSMRERARWGLDLTNDNSQDHIDYHTPQIIRRISARYCIQALAGEAERPALKGALWPAVYPLMWLILPAYRRFYLPRSLPKHYPAGVGITSSS
ncbi:hypothetical protein KEM52_004206 [Ascosphaera acerosa]|nr:hypothetical protein KEM52_004206 [Ascosphaera acerosa]